MYTSIVLSLCPFSGLLLFYLLLMLFNKPEIKINYYYCYYYAFVNRKQSIDYYYCYAFVNRKKSI